MKTRILGILLAILMVVTVFALTACDEQGLHIHIPGDDGFCILCDAPLRETKGLIYELSDDGTYASLVAYEGNSTRINIADEYMGVPVEVIGEKAFYQKFSITSVVIPDSVMTIGNYAFYACINLTSAVIGDNVTNIGRNAFYACESLVSIVLPDGVTSIDSSAFNGCISLVSIILPDSLTSISSSAFMGCEGLSSIVIPDSVITIGRDAFSGCTKLTFSEYENGIYFGNKDNPYFALVEITARDMTSYTIHNDTRIIVNSAFSQCNKLTSITIPDNVVTVGDDAFYGCENLTNVVMGDSVAYIGDSAFSYCRSLTRVVIPRSATHIGRFAFFLCDGLKNVYYTGTGAEWARITIEPDNSYIFYSSLQFNYVPEE